MADEKPRKNPLDGSDYELSPELEKEREKTEIPVSGKHMPVRIIVFVALLGIGVFFIVMSVLGFFSHSSGLQEISVTEDAATIRSGSSFTFDYYLDGTSHDVNGKSSEISKVYSKAMKEAYRLTDDYNVYEDAVSLAYISAHPNDEFKIDSRLYGWIEDMLGDEYGATSLYLGPVVRRWETIEAFPYVSIKTSDPSVSVPEKEYIDSYLDLVKDGEISISLLGESKVKLNLSDKFLNWGKENGYNGSYLTFGSMRNAYRAEYVKQALLAEGYQNGVLYTDDGLTVSLGGLAGLRAYAYLYEKGVSTAAGVLRLGDYDSFCSLHLSPRGGYSDGYAYSLPKTGEKDTLRSLELDPDLGASNGLLSNLLCVDKGFSIPSLKRRALHLSQSSSEEELLQKAKEIHANAVYSLNEDSAAIHVPTKLLDLYVDASTDTLPMQTY